MTGKARRQQRKRARRAKLRIEGRRILRSIFADDLLERTWGDDPYYIAPGLP